MQEEIADAKLALKDLREVSLAVWQWGTTTPNAGSSGGGMSPLGGSVSFTGCA